MNFIERNQDLILGAVFSAPVYLALTAAWVRRLTRDIRDLEEANAGLLAELEAGKGEWVEGDRPLPEDEAIEAAHPANHAHGGTIYLQALRLVSARRSKYGLVNLVNWLLVEQSLAASAPADALPDVQEPLDSERDAGER